MLGKIFIGIHVFTIILSHETVLIYIRILLDFLCYRTLLILSTASLNHWCSSSAKFLFIKLLLIINIFYLFLQQDFLRLLGILLFYFNLRFVLSIILHKSIESCWLRSLSILLTTKRFSIVYSCSAFVNIQGFLLFLKRFLVLYF